MALLDMRDTLDLATGERALAWRAGIHELYPNASSLMNVLMRTTKRKKVDTDPEVNWWERDHAQRELIVETGDVPDQQAAGASDTLDVDDGAYECPKHSLIFNTRTFEIVMVSADPTTDTDISIVRGIGGTGNQATWADNDVLQVIHTSHPEGDSVPSAISRPPTKVNNYLGIHRHATNNTNTALATRLRTPQLRQRAKAEALKDHEVSKAWSCLLGRKSERSTSDGIVRTSAGVMEFCTTHVYNAAAGFTKSGFRSWFYDVMEHGSDEKWLACGLTLFKIIEEMCEYESVQFREVPETDTYGISVKTLMWGGKRLHVSPEAILSRSTTFTSWGFCLDFDQIEYAYLTGRDTDWKPNRQNPGDDRNIGEWLAEMGWVMYNADDTMGYVKTATSYSP